MKRVVTLFILAVAATAAAVAAVAVADNMPAKQMPKAAVIRGEIVDMGCFLGHGAKGEKHQSCAAKCIAGGMPMGLLTPAGKLYLLTLDHDSPDPFNKCKDMAAQSVEVTGTVMQRAGMMAIDVTDVKAAPAGNRK
jgi:hypothetical protein